MNTIYYHIIMTILINCDFLFHFCFPRKSRAEPSHLIANPRSEELWTKSCFFFEVTANWCTNLNCSQGLGFVDGLWLSSGHLLLLGDGLGLWFGLWFRNEEQKSQVT